MEAEGNLQYAEDNFDYEALGRDLEIEGYTYVSGGALMVFQEVQNETNKYNEETK